MEVAAKAVLAGADVDMPIKLEVDCIRPLGPLGELPVKGR